MDIFPVKYKNGLQIYKNLPCFHEFSTKPCFKSRTPYLLSGFTRPHKVKHSVAIVYCIFYTCPRSHYRRVNLRQFSIDAHTNHSYNTWPSPTHKMPPSIYLHFLQRVSFHKLLTLWFQKTQTGTKVVLVFCCMYAVKYCKKPVHLLFYPFPHRQYLRLRIVLSVAYGFR